MPFWHLYRCHLIPGFDACGGLEMMFSLSSVNSKTLVTINLMETKGGTIYRCDWYHILFSPSIYRIEEVDQISPYRNRVIFVFVCVVLWPHQLAIHYNALNSPWFKILHTECTYYFYSGHEERGNISNLQLLSRVEHQGIHRHTVYTSLLPLDQLLNSWKRLSFCFEQIWVCRYIDRQMVDISIWQLTSICHP